MAKIDDSVKKKVPELRFPGFTDDWEERKLGDLATSFEYGLNASAKSFDGTHKYIRITDIDDSSRKFNSQSLTSPDIDLSSADNYKLKNGDILFARTGASVGKSYIYADSDGLVYYAGFLIRARIKSGVDSNFVFQHTLTSSYENFIRVTSQRSGQPGVNAKEYSTFEISVPSYEEQRKIGSFFKQLDDTITLHQRKIDLLKEQKKGYLQKMFPKNGAKVPELRFEGFADDWEQRKLGEFSDVRDGTHASPKYVSQGHPMVTSKNLTHSGLDMTDVSFLTDEDFNEINKRSKVSIGDILFGMIGTIGNPVIVDRDDFAIKNVALIKEKTSNPITNKWLLQYLKSPSFNRFIQKENAGGTQKFIALGLIRDMKLRVPEFDEQQKIGAFFKKIDDTIALHQRKLDLLKEQKKGFLQKMFV
ncbi:restriction endonuclease subunit S (plasmid) [Lactococcus cremoris]|uniref:Restriction endonuclease subunit S n=3 Tax=Lactococcus TaxID=1357 RepID=A0A1V0PE54_LACLC|nr:restriction endonuclease subunit S [Lactococcus cremoris]ARE27465.1 restriction endonuclease subunit S [Lactococcus cremoris]KZK46022.1 Type I restriction-modification system specificity subunit S [Lactococcus cremoris]UXV62273.1 restriction endonuclease subunit S [Lactococcus cremoris]